MQGISYLYFVLKALTLNLYNRLFIGLVLDFRAYTTGFELTQNSAWNIVTGNMKRFSV